MKIGRNDPCYCGSGKKYKRCHLSASPSMTANGRQTVSIPLLPSPDRSLPPGETHPLFDPETQPDFLVHGHLQQFGTAYAFEYDPPLPAPYGARPVPEGYPGEYEVAFTLQPPSRVILDGGTFDVNPELPGGSLLGIAKPVPRADHEAVAMRVECLHEPLDPAAAPVNLRYLYSPNDQGLLSTIRVRLQANNSIEAERVARQNLEPALSNWAFVYDIPLEVARVRVEEIATKSVRVYYLHQPYKTVGFDPKISPASAQVPENYHLLLFYREALQATSPHYQFLCFYKVMDLVKWLHDKRARAARASGENPSTPPKTLTQDKWLTKNVRPDLLSQVLGKKYAAIKECQLRPMRNRIAHALLDNWDPTEEPTEELLYQDDVYRLLPLVHYLARHLVAEEMHISLPDQA
jgi:hypothetical protein